MKRGFLFYFSVIFLSLIILGAVTAEKIALYDPNRETREHSFHPPTPIHFIDAQGNLYLHPFVYKTRVVFDENLNRRYVEITDKQYFLRFGKAKLVSVEKPAKLYLMGTDSRGRDLFSRALFGARTSLSIGIFGVTVAVFLGFLIGGISGYFGGWVDQVLMRVAEFFIMIPGFYFLLALRAALPPTLGSFQIYLLIVLVLSLIGWGGIARIIRGMVLSLRERDFVLASKMLGRKPAEILSHHILPHTFSYLAVMISVSIPAYILGEAFLSVLGLGIQEPAISWGNLLTEAMSFAHIKFHPWVLWPGFLIFFTALACNALGDFLKEKELRA